MAAALGFLAITAIGVGGLASLARGKTGPSATTEPVAPVLGAAPTPSNLLNHSARLEHEVREAEQAVTRARAAISSARQQGAVDPALLSEFERRLGLLGESPLDAVRRSYGGASSTPDDAQQDREGRSHLRAIASSPRQL